MSSQRKPKKIAKIDVTYDLTSKFDVSQFLTFYGARDLQFDVLTVAHECVGSMGKNWWGMLPMF